MVIWEIEVIFKNSVLLLDSLGGGISFIKQSVLYASNNRHFVYCPKSGDYEEFELRQNITLGSNFVL